MKKNLAPDTSVITGIWIGDARNLLEGWAAGETEHPKKGGSALAWAFTYMMAGAASIPAAEADIIKGQRGKAPGYRRFDKSEGLTHLTQACMDLQHLIAPGASPTSAQVLNVAGKLGKSHKSFSDLLERLGYKEIDLLRQEKIRKKNPHVGGAGGGR